MFINIYFFNYFNNSFPRIAESQTLHIFPPVLSCCCVPISIQIIQIFKTNNAIDFFFAIYYLFHDYNVFLKNVIFMKTENEND